MNWWSPKQLTLSPVRVTCDHHRPLASSQVLSLPVCCGVCFVNYKHIINQISFYKTTQPEYVSSSPPPPPTKQRTSSDLIDTLDFFGWPSAGVTAGCHSFLNIIILLIPPVDNNLSYDNVVTATSFYSTTFCCFWCPLVGGCVFWVGDWVQGGMTTLLTLVTEDV